MRKSLQTKVGSFNQDDHCTQFEKLLRKTNTIEKKIIDLFDSSSQLQIPSCNIACKTNEVLSRCKKSICCCCWNTFYFEYFQMFCYITTYFWTVYQKRKKRVVTTTTIWTFLFLFDSFPSCSYQSLVVTTTLYRSLLKRKETQPTTKVCFPKRQFFS